MDYKYFKVTQGVLIERAKNILNTRTAVIESIMNLKREVGAEHVFECSDGTGISYFSFTEKPDTSFWKKSCDGWMPKKSTKQGKVIQKSIDSIPVMEQFPACLDTLNLDKYVLYGDAKGYGCEIHRARVCGVPKQETYFIICPHTEEEPFTQIHEDMISCEEWEMLKFMQENKEK